MAYACPVCDHPQVDAEHLANHLAFTAIGGDDAHEDWLDETVEGWGELGQAELAEIVVENATETDFPIDVADHDVGAAPGSHEHSGGHDHHGGTGQSQTTDDPPTEMPSGDLDEDAKDVLEEARELTRRMQDDGGDADGGEGDGGGDDDRDETDSTSDGDEASDSTAADATDSETQ